MRLRLLVVAVLTAIYASCFALIEAVGADAPPLAFAALRTTIAGIALLAFTAAVRRPLLPPRRQLPAIAALALTATAISYGAMFASPGRAGVGTASVLGNLQPLFVVGLAAAVLGERLARDDRVALALGVLGAIAIAAPALGDGGIGLSGPLLALASSFGFAAASVLVKRLDLRSTLLTVTSWQLLLGSLPLLAGWATVERGRKIAWGAEFAAVLLFLALVGTAGATATWYRLLQCEEVGRLSVFLFLVPVFALALAAVVYGEPIGPVEAVGVALVLAATVVAMLGAWRTGEATDHPRGTAERA